MGKYWSHKAEYCQESSQYVDLNLRSASWRTKSIGPMGGALLAPFKKRDTASSLESLGIFPFRRRSLPSLILSRRVCNFPAPSCFREKIKYHGEMNENDIFKRNNYLLSRMDLANHAPLCFRARPWGTASASPPRSGRRRATFEIIEIWPRGKPEVRNTRSFVEIDRCLAAEWGNACGKLSQHWTVKIKYESSHFAGSKPRKSGVLLKE